MFELDRSVGLPPVRDGEISPVVGKVVGVEKDLNRLFRNRQDEVRMMALAALSGHHVLMLGGTGAGKTALASRFLDHFDGTCFTHRCAIRDREHHLFGPLDMRLFHETGQRVRSGENFLQGADWAFIDELFDAPDQILRMLLSIMNEGEFKEEDGNWVKAQLQSLIAAANYVRVNDVTAAVIDRFMFAPVMRDDPSVADLVGISMDHQAGLYGAPVGEKLSLDDVKALRAASSRVMVSPKMEFLKALIIHFYKEKIKSAQQVLEGVYPTRRAVWTTGVLQASALLDGRSEVGLEDLDCFRYCTSGNVAAKDPAGSDRAMRESVDAVKGYMYASRQIRAQVNLISACVDGRLDHGQLARLADKAGIEESIPRRVAEDPRQWLLGKIKPSLKYVGDFRDWALKST